MIDRQKLETVLSRRFPDASGPQIAAAANAIMGFDDEWEEVGTPDDVGHNFWSRCVDICTLERESGAGTEFRVLRRRVE
jgi:hypothetical protein